MSGDAEFDELAGCAEETIAAMAQLLDGGPCRPGDESDLWWAPIGGGAAAREMERRSMDHRSTFSIARAGTPLPTLATEPLPSTWAAVGVVPVVAFKRPSPPSTVAFTGLSSAARQAFRSVVTALMNAVAAMEAGRRRTNRRLLRRSRRARRWR